MTSKSGIRPPRPPKRESPAVTIAMQQKQIEMLVDRMEVLRKREFELGNQINMANDRSKELEEQRKYFENKHKLLQLAYIRMEGFQDCAREVFDRLLEKPNAVPR